MSTLRVNRKPNNLLYAEMIIALLFFVISFAVIIRVFASADGLERRSRQRQSAALCAQSIAEAYSVTADVRKSVNLALGADMRDFSGNAEVGLDSGFYPVSSTDQAEIILLLSETEEKTGAGVYSELTVEFYDSLGEERTPVYSLKCGSYAPEGGAAVG